MKDFAALGALLLAVTVFAGGFIAARFHFEAGGTPAEVVLLRYAPAALLLAPAGLSAVGRIGLGRGIALGLGQGVPFGSLIFVGMQGAPIAHGSAITPGLGLILGVLGSALLLGERLTGGRLAGLALGLTGIAVLVGPAALGAGAGAWWAELAYMGAGVLVAAFTVMTKVWRVPPLDAAALAMTCSAPLAVVAVLAFPVEPGRVGDLPTAMQALYQGVVFAIGGVALFALAISRLGPVASVAATPLLPAVATALDHLIFGAPLTPAFALALALMTGCVILLARRVAAPAAAVAATPAAPVQ